MYHKYKSTSPKEYAVNKSSNIIRYCNIPFAISLLVLLVGLRMDISKQLNNNNKVFEGCCEVIFITKLKYSGEEGWLN